MKKRYFDGGRQPGGKKSKTTQTAPTVNQEPADEETDVAEPTSELLTGQLSETLLWLSEVHTFRSRYVFPVSLCPCQMAWSEARWTEILQLTPFEPTTDTAIDEWGDRNIETIWGYRPTQQILLRQLISKASKHQASAIAQACTEPCTTLQDFLDAIGRTLFKECKAPKLERWFLNPPRFKNMDSAIRTFGEKITEYLHCCRRYRRVVMLTSHCLGDAIIRAAPKHICLKLGNLFGRITYTEAISECRKVEATPVKEETCENILSDLRTKIKNKKANPMSADDSGVTAERTSGSSSKSVVETHEIPTKLDATEPLKIRKAPMRSALRVAMEIVGVPLKPAVKSRPDKRRATSVKPQRVTTPPPPDALERTTSHHEVLSGTADLTEGHVGKTEPNQMIKPEKDCREPSTGLLQVKREIGCQQHPERSEQQAVADCRLPSLVKTESPPASPRTDKTVIAADWQGVAATQMDSKPQPLNEVRHSQDPHLDDCWPASRRVWENPARMRKH